MKIKRLKEKHITFRTPKWAKAQYIIGTKWYDYFRKLEIALNKR